MKYESIDAIHDLLADFDYNRRQEWKRDLEREFELDEEEQEAQEQLQAELEWSRDYYESLLPKDWNKP